MKLTQNQIGAINVVFNHVQEIEDVLNEEGLTIRVIVLETSDSESDAGGVTFDANVDAWVYDPDY